MAAVDAEAAGLIEGLYLVGSLALGDFRPRTSDVDFVAVTADPVTWRTVARHGVACRGPAPANVHIWLDQSALKAWCLDNLDRYWQRLLERAGVTASFSSLAALTSFATVWVVLGVSRIHYTLATGEICSKEAAGRYARATFPPNGIGSSMRACAFARANAQRRCIGHRSAGGATRARLARWSSRMRGGASVLLHLRFDLRHARERGGVDAPGWPCVVPGG